MSYGNSWTEINLNTKKNTLIIGKNGSGKSTLLDALTFALFGKPYRNINKPQLVNSIIDKNTLVELNFTIGKKKYLIRRGIKPVVFEIYCNGDLIKQDSLSKDYQIYLENNILKLNYKSFCQIVVLGSANYIPFMQLTANARRTIIEDLLDLQVFSSMNVILKERVNDNKDQLLDLEQEIKVVQSNLELHEKHIKASLQDRKEKLHSYKEKIKVEKEEISTLNKEKATHEHELKNYKKQLEALNKFEFKKEEIETFINKCNSTLKKLNKEKEFYNTSCSCPTCKQEISEKHKISFLAKCEKTIDKVEEKLSEINKKSETVNKKLAEKEQIHVVEKQVKKLITDVETKIHIKNTLIDSYNNECEELKNKDTSEQISTKAQFEEKLSEYKESKKKLIELKEILTIASQLLKDGGIKTVIIKQYIPIINKIINQYLNHMNFFIEFNLDDNFDEVIKSRHRDEFSYNSFSEGEKSRINLAILFAWRAIAKMRNTASTNLLIFDEIFDSSLDNDGTDDFMKILNTLTGDTNVFIISHKTDNVSDKFDTILKFDKVRNFSKMEIL
jgi:DNA repair exonuclease SbcCD ATPase subunit